LLLRTPISLLLLSLSGHLRALPSFPTRRSSDLNTVVVSSAHTRRTDKRIEIIFFMALSSFHFCQKRKFWCCFPPFREKAGLVRRSEEHTSELQSRFDLVCRLLLEKKNKTNVSRE